MNSYTIIGCPESTDLDIVVVCSSLDDTITIDCRSDKKVDMNKIIIQNNTVTQVEKGTPHDTHAIIFYTQYLHSENTKLLPLSKPQPLCLIERKYNLIKFIFDKLEQLTDKVTYKTTLRPIKIEIYTKSIDEKLEFIKQIFNILKSKRYSANDTYKAFVMKAVQFILLYHQIELSSDFFTKQGLIRLLSSLSGAYTDQVIQTVRYYLYRGKQGYNQGLSVFLDILFQTLNDKLCV